MILTSIKRMLLVFTVLVTALFSVQNAKACHLAAADIFVTYVGAGADGCSAPDYQYEVTLVIYYACQTCFNDGEFNQSIRVQSTEAGFNQAFVAPPFNPTDADTVHGLCGEFADSNSCIRPDGTPGQPIPYRAANFPGYQAREYRTGPITLSAATDWTFSWSSGVRNASGNLVGQPNLYVEAGLDNTIFYNNSTPRFTSNPLPYICINQPFTYLNSPADINGDSISVVQQQAYSAAGVTIAYQAGYNNADPIGSSVANPYNLNSATGAATFTPSTQGFFVLAFRAEDYVKGTGTRLSYVYRDVQVAVLPCQAPPPQIDTLSQGFAAINNASVVETKNFGEVVYVCPGSNMSLSLNSKTVNPSAKVFMSANTQDFAGSGFTVQGQGTSNVTGTFTWTPDQTKIGEHTLVVASKDSTCLISQPIVLPSYRVILIRVVKGIDAGPDIGTCELNPQPLPFYVYGAEELKLKWTSISGGPAVGLNNDTIANPRVVNGQEAEYIVFTSDLTGTCKARDTVALFHDKSNDIYIRPKNTVDTANALVMCLPGYLQLEAFPVGRGRKDNVPCGVTTPQPCPDEETNVVYGTPVFGEAVLDTMSDNTTVLQYKTRTQKVQYLIKKEELRKADIWSATLNGVSMDVVGGTKPNHVYTNFRMSIKCTDMEKMDKADGFEDEGLTEVYNNPAVQFPDGEFNFPFAVPYNLDTSKNLLVQICYSNNPVVDTCGEQTRPPFFKYAPTSYASALRVVPLDSTVFSLCDVVNSPDIAALQSRPVMKFRYCETKALDHITKWIYGEQLSDTTTVQSLAYVAKSTYFVAQTIGRSGCIMRDTLNVYVPEHDIRIEPADTAICLGDKAPFTIYGGHFFKWYEYENGQYIDPVSVGDPKAGYTFLGPDKTTEYRIVVSDSVFCYDTIAANVKVLPLPNVRILNEDDTVIKYGQSFKILATGARYYNWSPVSSLNNPNISYPVARPTEDTKYIVGGIGANGCRSFDTLHVIVDKRDNLFVPSAFSPNGDGKNDLFRITNLSFQRIMEFRVFNRWGQEVYSTNDSRAGWDGTWGGVPQDMGTYTYLIRVAYPDGFVETYKGETTLIR